mgnify:FL=1
MQAPQSPEAQPSLVPLSVKLSLRKSSRVMFGSIFPTHCSLSSTRNLTLPVTHFDADMVQRLLCSSSSMVVKNPVTVDLQTPIKLLIRMGKFNIKKVDTYVKFLMLISEKISFSFNSLSHFLLELHVNIWR